MGTVLQCVDRRCDRDGSFDAAVGQRPATVLEVTEGECHLLALDWETTGCEEGGSRYNPFGRVIL